MNAILNDLRPFLRYARRLSADMKKFPFPVCGYDCRLFYCTGGRGKMTIDGESHEVKQGVLIYIKAGIPYHYLPDESDPMRLLAFNFDLTFEASERAVPVPPDGTEDFDRSRLIEDVLIEDVPFLNRYAVFSGMGHLYEKLSELNEEYTAAKRFYESRCSGILLSVISELALFHENELKGVGEDKLEAVLDYISKNYAQNITNGQLGELFGYHPNYLNQLFIRYTGKTLHNYLQELRLKKAVSLLQETDLPVADVATSVGFKDIPHFSRYFKQKIGHTPSYFR